MSEYPRVFTIEPILEWPGELTTRREVANFRSPSYTDPDTGRWVPAARTKIGKTMRELATEFEQIKATNPRLQVAVTRDQITLDGRLYARAQPWHPGVILVFDSPRGEQRYPSDHYSHWEDNLRAIVLTLNAMRGIERWGVGDVRGSYLAIESARAMPSTPFGHEPASVLRWLTEFLQAEPGGHVPTEARAMIRLAQRTTHPDHGGDAEQFRLVNLAENYLREAGEL